MLRDYELLARAHMYRDMANRAHDPALKLELIENAERYELVVVALRFEAKPSPEDADTE